MLSSSPNGMKGETTGGPDPVAVKTNSQPANRPTKSPVSTMPTASAPPAVSTPSLSPDPCTQTGKRKAEAQGGSDEKRQKGSPERFMQHPRFWFPDGNLQVQIGPIRFNLHRSRLIAASTWIKRYFEERDTKEIEDGIMIMDGREVVELDETDINITDFERLLIAMDDIVDYHHSPPSFAMLASVYRAASILDVRKFRSYARRALEALFPDSLSSVGAATSPHAAEAIVLAREWGLPRVLKRAFYELARSPPTVATASALGLLSPADIILIAQAQKHLIGVWSSIYTFLGCDMCTPNPRLATSVKLSDMSWLASHSNDYRFDPILGLAALPQAYAKQKHYCPSCVTVREKEWKTRATTIWNTDLNVWFGLGDRN